MKKTDLQFSKLINPEKLQSFFNIFYRTTHIPFLILDLDGNILVDVGMHKKYVKNKDITLSYPQIDDYIKSDVHARHYLAHKHKNGLWDIALPMMINDELIATFIFGQFRHASDENTEEHIKQFAEAMGLDFGEYIQFYQKIPIYDDKGIEKRIALAEALIDQIVDYCKIKKLLNAEINEKIAVENSLYSLYDDSLQGIVIMQNGRILSSNSAFCHISGYTEEELLDIEPIELGEFLNYDYWNFVLDHYGSNSAFKLLFESNEFQGNHKDGSTFWVRLHISRITVNGKPAIRAIVVDISELKEIQVAFEQTREDFRNMEETVSELISRHDINGKFLFSSPASLALLGYKNDELLNQNLFNLLHPDDVKSVEIAFSTIAELPVTYIVNYRIKRADGNYIWFETTSKSINIDDEELPVEIYCVSRDITDQKFAEHKQKQLIDELEKAEDEIKTRDRVVPICAKCKKIQDEEGIWQLSSVDIAEKLENGDFIYTICPECAKTLNSSKK